MECNNSQQLNTPAPDSKNALTHSPCNVYCIIIIATTIMLGIMLFFMYIGYTFATKYSPLSDAIIKIQFNSSQAHLWLEEFHIGDRDANIETIAVYLDKTIDYCKAMLEGDTIDSITIKPATDPILRQKLETLYKELINTRDITFERIEQIANPSTERAIDLKLDKQFREQIIHSQDIEKYIKSIINSTFKKFRFMQIGFAIAFILLSISILRTIKAYENKRNLDLQKIHDRENYLRAIYQSVTSIAVIPASLEGEDAKILDFNSGAERLFGYRREEVVGKKVSILHLQTDVNKFQSMQEYTTRDSFYEGEFEMVRKNGETFPAIVTLHPRYDANNKQIGVTGIVADITNQKNYEEQINQYTEKLQSMVDERTNELATQNIRLQETFDKLKHSQTQIVQSEKMAALGMLLASVAHEINNPLGAIINSNTLLKTNTHTIIDMLPEVSRYFADNDGLAIDLMKEATETHHYLSSKEKRDIKNKIFEDLKNLVPGDHYAITHKLIDIGITSNYKKYFPLLNSEYGGQLLDLAYSIAVICQGQSIIEEGTEKTEKIVSALKDYAHSGNIEEKIEANVNHTIETVLILYGNKIRHGIELKLDLQEIPPIKCYPQELNQIWTNLVQNAIHAMNDEGTMEICSRHIDNTIEVTITDSGCGIPENIKDKIFEPLFTTKPAGIGSGIGLDIVKQIIQKHNGSISFTSSEGKGTTFTVSLPIDQN